MSSELRLPLFPASIEAGAGRLGLATGHRTATHSGLDGPGRGRDRRLQVGAEIRTGFTDPAGLSGGPWLLRAGEVATLLGLSRSKVFAMMAGEELPVIRIGKCVRVPREELVEWLRVRTTLPTDCGIGAFIGR